MPDGPFPRHIASSANHRHPSTTIDCTKMPHNIQLRPGDISNPGLLWRNDLLYVGYDSTHQAQTSIYLAKVRFP